MSSHDGRNGARSPEHRYLGGAVAELRELNGLSQAELADRAQLRRSHLAAIERGEVDPTFVTLVRIVRAIPAPLAQLFELFERRRDAANG
ncbi:MAG TPA: helix-turn-helix transcriptional regulator [Conexibacter sp.]|nr:helix-turn-helix transcriptional regulator [Conexibacter sp.]